MTTVRRRRVFWLVCATGVLLLLGGYWWRREHVSAPVSTAAGPQLTGTAHRERAASADAVAPDSSRMAPAGVRIRVRVLNASGERGMAKHLTFALRALGYDVVDFDNEPKRRLSVTSIEAHAGHADWAERLRRAVGTGAVVAQPDSLRYVDFTVHLGSDWHPPAHTLRP